MFNAASSLRAVLALFGLPGHWELLILLFAILLLFGGRKLPELARGLARSLRTFKDELHGVKKDLEEPPEDKADEQENEKDQPKEDGEQ